MRVTRKNFILLAKVSAEQKQTELFSKTKGNWKSICRITVAQIIQNARCIKYLIKNIKRTALILLFFFLWGEVRNIKFCSLQLKCKQQKGEYIWQKRN